MGDPSVFKPTPGRDEWGTSDRLDWLESRADRLDSRCRVLTATCAALVVVIAACGVREYRRPSLDSSANIAAERLVAPWVVTSRLTVMNGEGGVFAEFGALSEDDRQGSMAVFDTRSKARSVLTAGTLRLIDDDDLQRVVASAVTKRGPDSQASLSIGDQHGFDRLVLTAEASESTVEIRDGRGLKRAVVGVGSGAKPYLEMDADGSGLKRITP